MVNESVTTVNLTGEPVEVSFAGMHSFYWINNLSDSGDVYVTLGGTPEADKDGTYTVPAGSQLRIPGAFNKTLTLLGSGKAQVIASSIASCPFKVRGKGGGNNETLSDGVILSTGITTLIAPIEEIIIGEVITL